MNSSQFRLYWWRPQRGVNLGDEISPLIFSKLASVDVVHADANGCDGIAIGSVFHPRRASNRRRKSPLFVWGSGTLAPMPCVVEKLSVILAALRGPLTAGEISNCPDVPFGDPGLFVREIWPQAKPSSTKVGIIPHHALRRSKNVSMLKESFQDAEVLDFTHEDIAATIGALSRCRLIVSSSLHGLILADSYGIPSIFWNDLGVENEWKYRDYFLGVGRESYVSVTTSEIIEIVKNGEETDLPWSVLPESKLRQVLGDLRKVLNLLPDPVLGQGTSFKD